jgi:general secretion pathway protein G
MMDRLHHKGFTLIEVIIVIALVSILSTAMIMIINPVQQFKKARDAQRKSDLRQLQAALELYRADNAAYPAALPACNASFTGTNGAVYLQKVPCDPKNTATMYKYALSGTTGYTLYGCLENTNDTQGTVNATDCPGGLKFVVTNP